MRRVLLWIDADANYEKIGSRAEIRRVVYKAKEAGITTLVLDVKPVEGSVLYRSRIAPFYEKKGTEVIPNHDPLAVLIAEARSMGLEVHASMNVFCEGRRKKGLVYESKAEWATHRYDQALYLKKGDEFIEVPRYNSYPRRDEIAYITDDLADTLKVSGTALIIKDNKVAEIVTSGEISLKNNPVIYGQGPKEELLKGLLGALLVTRPEIRPITKWATPSQGFVNPILPEVQAYELALMEEVVSHYQIDGIVLDRVRYNDIHSDFSPQSKAAFEEFLGKNIKNWPKDILRLSFVNGKKHVEYGPLAKDWFFFRSLGIKEFFIKARNRVKELRPDVLFGDYAGSWYPEYYKLGVNWASENYQPKDQEIEIPGYEETGYAEVLDYLTSGNYYEDVYIKDLENKVQAKLSMRTEAGQSLEYKPWYSVEGAAKMVNEAVMDATKVYGGLYLLQYYQKPEVFQEAMKTCLKLSDGLMLFDLVYLDMYNWWDILADTLRGET
jgi:hypothetical protein